MKAITVHGVDLPAVQYRGQRVVTLAMIDKVHQRPKQTAIRNFLKNRERFIANEDYFELTGDEIRHQSLGNLFPPRTPKAYLMTESGYLLLVKSFTDDLAWEIQRTLVETYFRAKAHIARRFLATLATNAPDLATLDIDAEGFAALCDLMADALPTSVELRFVPGGSNE